MDFKARLESVSQLPTNEPYISGHSQHWEDNVYSWVLYHLCTNGQITGISASNMERISFHSTLKTVGTPSHSHAFIEIGYILEGELILVFKNERLLFRQGELFMIGRNVPHYELAPRIDSSYFYLLLPSSVFSDFFLQDRPSLAVYEFVQNSLINGKERYDNLLFRPKSPTSRAEKLLSLIAGEIEKHQDGYQYFVRGYLIRLFGVLFQNYELIIKPAGREKFKKLVYQQIDLYMKEHYADVSLEELSRIFSYNPAYFNRLIHAYDGQTFKQHLQKIRLEKAAQLLKHSELTVEQVARQVGYRNLGFFYKLFEQEYGMKPMAYRRT